MLHLLQLEWLKMRHFRPFKVIMTLYLVLLPLCFLTVKTFDLPREFDIDSLFIFPNIWLYMGYAGNWLSFLFLGFLAILLIVREFPYKTARQNIMTGLSRKEFIGGKMLFMLAVSVTATLYYTLLVLAFGFFNTDYIVMQRVTEQMYYIPRYCLMSFGYMCFAFLIGLWIRRTGLAILFYLTYTIILEPLLRALTYARIFPKSKISDYYPLNAIEDLVHFFSDSRLQTLLSSKHTPFSLQALPGWESVLFSSFYIALFIFLSFWLMGRRDL